MRDDACPRCHAEDPDGRHGPWCWYDQQARQERRAEKREKHTFVAEGFEDRMQAVWARMDTGCEECGQPTQAEELLMGDLVGTCPEGHENWRSPDNSDWEAVRE